MRMDVALAERLEAQVMSDLLYCIDNSKICCYNLLRFSIASIMQPMN